MIVHPDHPDLWLLEARDIELPTAGPDDGGPAYALPKEVLGPAWEVLAWADSYLSRPHPELGRPGPVCPYVPTARRTSLLFLAVVSGVPTGSNEVERVLQQYRDWFDTLEPTTGADAELKSVLVLFPDLPADRCRELIEDTQLRLKASFVRQGLMVGEFHPTPPAQPGLWNPDFRPLRSPLPLLAIRRMVPSDLPFLTHRQDFLEAYLSRFADAVPSRCQEQLDAAMATFGLVPPWQQLHPEVVCALTRHRVQYTVHSHADQPVPVGTPGDLARALGYPLGRITKTLLLQSLDARPVARVVTSVSHRVDLSRVAAHLGLGRLRLASASTLSSALGYPSGGVSPLGVDVVPVVLDAALLDHPTLLVGAGVRGVDVEISPSDLMRACGAHVIPLSVPDRSHRGTRHA